MTKIGIHCYVVGIVQGVSFRRETCKQATYLKLTGWVQNLKDGRVEVMAFGEEKAVDQLKNWLKQGPPAAKVYSVEVNEVPIETFINFQIR